MKDEDRYAFHGLIPDLDADEDDDEGTEKRVEGGIRTSFE